MRKNPAEGLGGRLLGEADIRCDRPGRVGSGGKKAQHARCGNTKAWSLFKTREDFRGGGWATEPAELAQLDAPTLA